MRLKNFNSISTPIEFLSKKCKGLQFSTIRYVLNKIAVGNIAYWAAVYSFQTLLNRHICLSMLNHSWNLKKLVKLLTHAFFQHVYLKYQPLCAILQKKRQYSKKLLSALWRDHNNSNIIFGLSLNFSCL